MEIEYSRGDRKGILRIVDEGKALGWISYQEVGTDRWLIDHTVVFPEYEGQGVGWKLVLALAEEARKSKRKVIPQCSFARLVFERNANLHDLLVGSVEGR